MQHPYSSANERREKSSESGWGIDKCNVNLGIVGKLIFHKPIKKNVMGKC
jgi:hypothetical protein